MTKLFRTTHACLVAVISSKHCSNLQSATVDQALGADRASTISREEA
jgi:hypothetical protein